MEPEEYKSAAMATTNPAIPKPTAASTPFPICFPYPGAHMLVEKQKELWARFLFVTKIKTLPKATTFRIPCRPWIAPPNK
jgi:hypothetical protein